MVQAWGQQALLAVLVALWVWVPVSGWEVPRVVQVTLLFLLRRLVGS